MSFNEPWSGVPPFLVALLLLVLVNSAPILLKRLLGLRLASPLDGGWRFVDGRPLLGTSKTWRGLIGGILIGIVAAPLAGLPLLAGAGFAAASMAGDLLSSFSKRRLGLPPGGRAMVLDQIPEALLPLFLYREALALDWPAIAGAVLAFLLIDVVISRLLYRAGLRDRPH